MERMLFLLLLLFGASFTITSQASTCSVRSPDHRIALLELYTSEGCSSCPPADKWLSDLDKRGLDSNKVVPLALHVDYWNYIGWKDPYSSVQYTKRQREVASRNRLRTIYTPQMVLQGQDFRSWRRVDFKPLLKAINEQAAPADIAFTILPNGKGTYDLKVNASVRDSKMTSGGHLLIAIYESRLKSSITAGENEGRVLQHDYVVRSLYPPVALSAAGKAESSFNLHIPPEWDTSNLGIAAFIEHPQQGILQAFSAQLVCG